MGKFRKLLLVYVNEDMANFIRKKMDDGFTTTGFVRRLIKAEMEKERAKNGE